MTTLHGGPRDGLELEVPPGVTSLNFALKDGPGSACYVPDGDRWVFDRINPPAEPKRETAIQPPRETR